MSFSNIQLGNSNIQRQSAGFLADYLPITTYLPMDILQRVCSFLDDPKDIIHFGLAHRYLTVLSLDIPLWSSLLRKHFPDSYAKRKSDTESLTLYKQQTNIIHNIKMGKFYLKRLIEYRIGFLFNTIIIYEGKFIFSSKENTIKILDLKTGQELQSLSGHRNLVSSIVIYDGKLISGSYDSTIKIWNLKTGDELKTLHGPQDWIRCIAACDRRIVSGIADNTIRIWDLETGEELQTLTGHENAVTCIVVYEDKLISSSWDRTIKIWDLKTGQLLQTLVGHERSVSCIAAYDNRLISGSMDNTIKIWDLKTGQLLQTLYEHHDTITSIAIYDGKFFSGSDDKTIKVWDLKTGQLLQTLYGNQGWAKSIAVCDGKLISGLGEDSTVTILDFNFPSLSSHPKGILEENLEILGKMAHAEWIHQPEVVEKLAEKLHTDFKERLKQHSYRMGSSFSCSAAVILCVQTEVCVEALLDAIHDEDHDRVSHLLKQLIWIDCQNTKIYELLWQVCGKIIFERWGEYAFHNQQGCSASLFQKEQAVVEFKQILKDRWR